MSAGTNRCSASKRTAASGRGSRRKKHKLDQRIYIATTANSCSKSLHSRDEEALVPSIKQSAVFKFKCSLIFLLVRAWRPKGWTSLLQIDLWMRTDEAIIEYFGEARSMGDDASRINCDLWLAAVAPSNRRRTCTLPPLEISLQRGYKKPHLKA